MFFFSKKQKEVAVQSVQAEVCESAPRAIKAEDFIQISGAGAVEEAPVMDHL